MSELSDSELISLARQGDKAAFGQLVSRYQPLAQRLSVRVIGNEDLAQDLVQEAMVQAYLSLENLRDPGRFKSWLHGIVLNVCRNDLRRRKVISFSLETMMGDLADQVLPMIDESLDPQRIAEQQERHTALLEAINMLSDKNRRATLLFYQKQLSLQEVAHQLGISVGAVKGRLHKSRHQLRAQLSLLQDPDQPMIMLEDKTMMKNSPTKVEPEFCCSFCSKTNKQVRCMIAGPLQDSDMVYICNECVEICNQIIHKAIPPQTQEGVKHQ